MESPNAPAPVLERLKAGVLRFQAGVYAERAEAYRYAAAHPQRPHTLVIACADSRVNVEALMSAEPGELFIARNVGNMVPLFREQAGEMAAVLEYAVVALKVQHIAVCGHSDCGGMKALLDPASTGAMPAVRSWLAGGEAALRDVLSGPLAGEDDAKRLRRLTEGNVLRQMENLRSYPYVAQALARGDLTTSGWVYEIGSGEVRIAEDGGRVFRPVRAR